MTLLHTDVSVPPPSLALPPPPPIRHKKRTEWWNQLKPALEALGRDFQVRWGGEGEWLRVIIGKVLDRCAMT
jgi:hypothetical protein